MGDGAEAAGADVNATIGGAPRAGSRVARGAGTRIPVSLVLDNLAAQVPEERLLAEYPSLTAEALRAALAYAAELAREQNIALPA